MIIVAAIVIAGLAFVIYGALAGLGGDPIHDEFKRGE